MVYTIIRKRQVFHSLANLPSDYGSITKSLNKKSKRHLPQATSHENLAESAMEGSHPALPAEPGTLKATLPDTPGIGQMTERESAHPSYHHQPMEQLPITNGMAAINLNLPGGGGGGEMGSGDAAMDLVRDGLVMWCEGGGGVNWGFLFRWRKMKQLLEVVRIVFLNRLRRNKLSIR